MVTKKSVKLVKKPPASEKAPVKVKPGQAKTVVSANTPDSESKPATEILRNQLDYRSGVITAQQGEIAELRKCISTLETSEAAANREMLEARRELEALKAGR